MTKTILRAELLENKEYVRLLHFEDGIDLVWKAPRPNSDLYTGLREQFNEIFCGRHFDEAINSRLEPRLYALDQQYGVLSNYIDQEWDANSVSSYTNSDKLNIFLGSEVWLHQQDRNKDAVRHLRVKTYTDNSSFVCPIDNGFSLMYTDESKIDTSADLDPQSIDNLLSSSFITSASDIDSIVQVIDGVDIHRVVFDVASHLINTCSFTPTIRGFIFGYAQRVEDYLKTRKSLLAPSLKEWWTFKIENKEKQEIPANAIP